MLLTATRQLAFAGFGILLLGLPLPVLAVGPTATTPYAWYRADAGVNVVGAGDNTVVSWDDQSGNGRAVVAVGAPRLTNDGPLGLPAITLDGSGSFLEGAVAQWGTAPPGTVFAVWRQNGGPSVGGVSYLYDGGRTDNGRQGLASNGVVVGALAPGNNVLNFTFPDRHTWNLSTVTYTGTDTVRLNGAEVVSGNLLSSGMDGILIGVFVVTARNWWNGEILEVVIYEGKLADAERNQVEAVLKSRWRLPGSIKEGAVTGSTVGLTAGTEQSTCDAGVSSPAAWFEYTAAVSGMLRLDTCGSSLDTVLSLFDATGQTELACNDDCSGGNCAGPASCLAYRVKAGSKYNVRVAGKGGVTGDFTLNAVLPNNPPNDYCEDAPPLAGGTEHTANVNATSEGQPASCASLENNPDIWYTYKADATGVLNLDTCGSAIDTVLTVYTGSCGALTELACSDDCSGGGCSGTASCVTVNAQKDATYLIRIAGKGGQTGDITLNITRPGATIPYAWYRADMGVHVVGSGDNTIVTWEDQSGNGRTISAIGAPQLTNHGPFGLPSVTLDGNNSYLEGLLQQWGHAQPGTVFAVWKQNGYSSIGGYGFIYDGGRTDSGRQCAASNGEFVGALAPGNNFIRITFPPLNTWNISTATYTGTDTVRINQVEVGAGNAKSSGMDGILVGTWVVMNKYWWNGEILELIVYEGKLTDAERNQVEASLRTRWRIPKILTEGTVTDTTASSTVAGEETSTCDPGVKSPAVWFEYEAASSGTLQLNTCGSAIDTVLSIFDASGQIELACNDDCPGAPCAGPASCLSYAVKKGTTYAVRVAGKGGATGDFTLTTVLPQNPPNDFCSEPTVISAGPVHGTTDYATSEGQAGSCGGIETKPDVWYSWTAPYNGTVSLDTCESELDTIIAVYAGECASLTEIACNDDCAGGACTTSESCLTFAVTQGTTYLIRVAAKTGTGAFELNLNANLEVPANSIIATVSGVPIFLDNGFEDDDPATAPNPPTIGFWIMSGDPTYAFVSSDATPGAASGSKYLHMELNPSGKGIATAAFSQPVTTGQRLRFSMMSLYKSTGSSSFGIRLLDGGTTRTTVWVEPDIGPPDYYFYEYNAFTGINVAKDQWQEVTIEYVAGSTDVTVISGGQNVKVGAVANAGNVDRIRILTAGAGTTLCYFDGFTAYPGCAEPFADADRDQDVDMDDFAQWQACCGPLGGPGCQCFDRTRDGKVDLLDWPAFVKCASRPTVPSDVQCDD